MCGALLVSGGTGLYFSYEENKKALAALQREKALGAATHIEQFVRRVAQQLAFAAPPLGSESIEQRRLELLKLLRLAKEVTDISQIGADGREQLSESRLAMSVVGSGKDRSQEPAFHNPRPGQPWFGPVYFRKETEPYMTVAVRSGGAKGPVTVAEVNLKFIWDVVTRIKVGDKGKAYVVDGKGYLIADPDIGLVLRKTDLSGLEQVKAALAEAGDARSMLARDPRGKPVLTAWAPIDPREEKDAGGDPLGWKVFVEQPASEVFRALDASILRNVALIVAGLLFSALAALWLARSMARPIAELQEGAQRIGAGELDHAIDVRTGDELEALAGQFNRMTKRLRESYAGLERKVEERTAELKEALSRQTAMAEILRVISQSTRDVQPVFDAIAASSLRLLNGWSVIIWKSEEDGVRIASVAGGAPSSLEPVRDLIGYIPFSEGNFVTEAVRERRPRQVSDAEADGVPPRVRESARLRGWRSNVAVPMLQGDHPVGVITLSRAEAGGFAEREIDLLQTFADQAVIAIENVRLFNETKEALEQQTATSEILKVISRSTSDTQPVFEAIVQSGLNLFPQAAVAVSLPQGDKVRLAAAAHRESEYAEDWKRLFPIPLTRQYINSLAILERRLIDVPDGEANTDPAIAPGVANLLGSAYRALTVMPMLRGGEAIGAISVLRRQPGPLSEKQIALLRTFADQAVIAIENVRLFNETREALEQQTATSQILQVTSSSPTDIRPVFDTILANAIRLCEGNVGVLWQYDDQRLRFAAHNGASAEAVKQWTDNPLELGDWNPTPQAGLERRTVHVLDVFANPNYRALVPMNSLGVRPNAGTVLAVPLLRYGELLGVITIWRFEKRLFSDKQVAMMETFAAQAVIAIENVRLFKETKESLEQQTAIGEVLRVISSTPTDVKPTLAAVAERATRLCDATSAAVYVLEGDLLRRAAFYGAAELQGSETLPYKPEMLTGRVVLEGKAIHVHDIERERENFPMSWQIAQRYGRHTMLAVPLMREGKPFGTMFLRRNEVRPFNEKQMALATTFADQAAIAIENVRLFNETREALEQQKASGEVLGAISASIADTRPVFEKILESCQRLFEGNLVGITLAVGDQVELAAFQGVDRDYLARIYPLPLTRESGTGWAILNASVAHFADIEAAGVPPGVVAGCRALGVRAIVFAPMLFEGKGIGAIWVARGMAGAFTDKQISLLKTFADQAVIAIQNARLFREIQEKSVQLEVANKHKSDFLANMSHELRTPLNAIIGFSEVLMEKMFGEVNEKQADYLKDIHESGRHLLSLINDILDLSKIEAGRMDLEISRFDLPSALANAMTLVRERAQRHGIGLGLQVDERLGEFQADERKVKQILLNLLSNAVKFTPDGGRIDVRAAMDTDKVEIAVCDTGIGIAPEDQAAVFEEFKQVGRDYTRKTEGTGLGLALTKRFVELHGGEIHLESAPGKGSTFTFTLPVRP